MVYNYYKYKTITKNHNRFYINNFLYYNKPYLPADREWLYSIYNYNKNNTKNLLFKDIIADRLIKKFFYLLKKKNYNDMSKRMRNLVIKSKTNRLWISKPETKQTSDKNTITIYTYDREKELFIKKFFFYKRLLNTQSEININKTRNIREYFKLKRLPLSGRKLSTEVKSYESKIISKINNFKANEKKNVLFKYLFLKWILSFFYFSVKNFNVNKHNFMILSSNIPVKLYQKYLCNRYTFVHKSNSNLNKLLKSNNLFKKRHNYISNSKELVRVDDKNTFLHLLLLNTLRLYNIDYYKVSYLYSCFRKLYYKSFLSNMLLRKIKLHHIREFYTHNIKFNRYILYLKLLLNRIYEKKVELNLVSLKYPFMDSNILVNSLSTKLRDRQKNPLRIIKMYLKIIKVMRFSSYINKHNNGLYEENLIINRKNTAKSKNITYIDKVKSKWITGVRLEAAGRLTNRYVAQRSVYHYTYKGNLKSMDYKPTMLRTFISSNLQNSYVQSKRRIGAFGIKGWISSN